MVPKVIHYIWVGNNQKPQLVLDCIETWKKHLPDYEIIEWGNESIKEMDSPYIHEAFYHEKWAFVSDYIRLYALNKFGGIYLDTDIEVTNSFDEFLNLDFFSCQEIFENASLPITSAVIGAEKNNRIIKDLLDIYQRIHFFEKNSVNLMPNTLRIAEYLKSKFNVIPPYIATNTIQLSESEIIFPYYYFCSQVIGEINFSIHHFSGSWKPSHSRKDKLNLANKLIISRFNKKNNNGEMPILSNERVLFSVNLSKKTSYKIIFRVKKGHNTLPFS